MRKFNNYMGVKKPDIDGFDSFNETDKAILAPIWYLKYHSNEWLTAYLAGENNEAMQEYMIATLTETLAELKQAASNKEGDL